jgi:hypothetical protein
MISDNAIAHTQVQRVYVMMVISSCGMVEHRSFSHVHSPYDGNISVHL